MFFILFREIDYNKNKLFLCIYNKKNFIEFIELEDFVIFYNFLKYYFVGILSVL